MKNLFKNKKTIALAILGTLSLIAIVFIATSANKHNTPPKTIQPTPSTSTIASWNGLTPGVSNQKDVTDTLGKPKTSNGNALSFGSQNPNFDNQVVIDTGVVDFLKEYIVPAQRRNSDEITSKYGVAQNVLYGPDSTNGFYLLVYPSNGIAYLGNPNTKDMLEIWYFKPTTISDFMNKWAKDYSLTPLNRQF